MGDLPFSLDQALNLLLMFNSVMLVAIGPARFFSRPHPKMRLPLMCFLAFAFGYAVCIGALPLFGVHVTSAGEQINMVGMGCFSAMSLFNARLIAPILYGALEVIVGIAGLGMAIFRPGSGGQLVIMLTLTGSVYVIVRGLANINDGLSKRWPVSPIPRNSPEVEFHGPGRSGGTD